MRLNFRRLILGRPLPTWRALHERLPKVLALPVFASDAMSSVAYATEEIIIYLSHAGAMALVLTMPITFAIIALLAIVATSYRQTIFAYPSGGGSYIVAHDNLGVTPGLIAAASLLIDYTLTVSVSISSGVAQLIAIYPGLHSDRVLLCLVFIAIIALANMRGLKESGLLFALPAYGFIASFAFMIVVGLIKAWSGQLTKAPGLPTLELAGPPAMLGIVLVLKAFAGGCTAMTGTEAISNGIPAFRPPESKNAAATLVYMAFVLGFLFLGISYLAQHLGLVHDPSEIQTIVSQISRSVFGHSWFYVIIPIFTFLILVLAAETSFADFPRLSSILARDRFMPRQLANIGDRLVFSNGILALWLLSSILVVVFKGITTNLIPLYAVGVFLSFTLSQAGMVVHARRLKEKGWRRSVVISAVGAVTTGIVTIVQLGTKFTSGAWIVALLIPIIVVMFRQVNNHYRSLAEQLRLPPGVPEPLPEMTNTVLVLVSGIHKGILPALQYAKSLSPDCRAVYIETEAESTPLIEERWELWGQGMPLVILESPYRSVVQPLMRYLEDVKEERTRHIVTVIVPEFVPLKLWHKILHGQSGLALKYALLFRRDIVVANIRYYLEK